MFSKTYIAIWGALLIVVIIVGLIAASSFGLIAKQMDAEEVKEYIVFKLGAATNRESTTTKHKMVGTIRKVYVEDDTLYIELNANSDYSKSLMLSRMENDIAKVMSGMQNNIRKYDRVRFTYYYPLIDENEEETIGKIYQIDILKENYKQKWDEIYGYYGNGLKKYTDYYWIHDDFK